MVTLGLSNENIFGAVPDFICGYCGQQTGYNVVYADRCEVLSEHGDFLDGYGFAILECRSCRLLNLVTLKVSQDLNEEPVSSSFDEPIFRLSHPEIVQVNYDPDAQTIHPVTIQRMGQFPAGLMLGSKVPVEIRNDLEEAARCICVNAGNAAVLMCRKAIERVAIGYGITPVKGSLDKTLQLLQASGKVPKTIIDDFLEVKEWGNIGAHVKDAEYESMQLADAQHVFNFITLVIDRLYNSPDRDAVRNLRDQKKKTHS